MFLQKDNINDAKIALDDGKIVGIPTETVYGLGVNPYSQEAVSNRHLTLPTTPYV